MKILGTIINTRLYWEENCSEIIKKVNARMQLIRELQSFGTKNNEMVHFWILFCRSVIEQSCVVWGTSLTQENIDNLERNTENIYQAGFKRKVQKL